MVITPNLIGSINLKVILTDTWKKILFSNIFSFKSTINSKYDNFAVKGTFDRLRIFTVTDTSVVNTDIYLLIDFDGLLMFKTSFHWVIPISVVLYRLLF